jgi:hypothetical protein
MTYRLYASEWHLTPTTTAEIFAIYPIVVVSVLIVFGGLSDQIGRRATMLPGLAASFLGALTLALARDVSWLFVARAFMGVGVGQIDVVTLAEQRAPGASRENDGVGCEPAALRPDARDAPSTRVETSYRTVLVHHRAEPLRATSSDALRISLLKPTSRARASHDSHCAMSD